jgi:predicted amidohydrolase YtcJ/amino acid transporter
VQDDEKARRLAQDARDLEKFGYAQQLLRDMGGFANFAVSFTIISILTGAIALFGHGLTFGGPAANGIGWPIVTLFTLCVAASLAEIASAIPTAGAMYHWSALLGGPGWGWFTAWFNLVGQVATTAGIDYGLSQFVVDLLGLPPSYILPLYAALLLSQAALNHVGIKLVAKINDLSVWYHIVVTLGICAAFWWLAPRRPLSFAFETGFTTSQYPYWWAFLVGLLQAQWTLTGYDASAHVTEETMDPRRNAPWGMFNAVLLSGVFGYLLLLAVTLAIQDLPAAAAAANPFIYICERALGERGGRALVWAVLPAIWFCGVASVTTNARMIYAFSRDNGLPRSDLWKTVSPRYKTPAAAIWLSAGLALVVALYSKAYAVIASLSVIGLYVSYAIPIVLVLRARLRGRWNEPGPWTLGRWGGLVNAVAAGWVAVISVLFVAPPNVQTGLTFAGLLVLLTIYYLGFARGAFKGPKVAKIAAVLLALAAVPAAAADADLILRGGKVFLGPGQFAAAVAVKGNRITAIGTDKEILSVKGPNTRVVELKGRLVTPGFHDAHVHLIKGAFFMTQIDLTGSTTIEELQARVGEFAATHTETEWVIGRGWDESKLPGGVLPTYRQLDAVVSSRPVALTDVDGHKMWLNSEALRRAGVTRATTGLPQGAIIRDGEEEPTGILVEEGMRMATRVIPPPDKATTLAVLKRALKHMRENGVTAVDSMPGIVDTPAAEQLELWRALAKSGDATARLVLYGRLEDLAGFEKLRKAARDLPRTRVFVAGVKGFVDGVLSARTAALREPYFDAPETRGQPKKSVGELNKLVRRAHEADAQVALHVVGDRAFVMALDACERSQFEARREEHVLMPHPCRFEHIELLAPEELKRFKLTRAAASMQPSHMLFDDQAQNYVPNRVGERSGLAFAWKSLDASGAPLAFGTDWPVMPLDPRQGLYAAVTRRALDGKPANGWIPDQKLSLEAALEHYTADPWEAVGLGDQLGSVRLGRVADLVVFDRDLLAAPPEDILKSLIDLTIFDGRVVYERAADAKPKKP